MFTFILTLGVLLAVDAVVNHLKTMSRNVTTPEEIAQVLMSCLTDGPNVTKTFKFECKKMLSC